MLGLGLGLGLDISSPVIAFWKSNYSWELVLGWRSNMLQGEDRPCWMNKQPRINNVVAALGDTRNLKVARLRHSVLHLLHVAKRLHSLSAPQDRMRNKRPQSSAKRAIRTYESNRRNAASSVSRLDSMMLYACALCDFTRRQPTPLSLTG